MTDFLNQLMVDDVERRGALSLIDQAIVTNYNKQEGKDELHRRLLLTYLD